jgi:DNA-binding CsgD family transcriptional regulator
MWSHWTPSDRVRSRVLDGIAAMQDAASLEEAARALVRTAMALVRCDHCGYSEIDEHFGRTRAFFSAPEIDHQVVRRAEVWSHYFPQHPVLQFRKANPDVSVVRLSDVTDLTDFYRSGLYRDLFSEVATRHQAVMHLGFHPGDRIAPGALPLTLGVSLNRSGSDFRDRDLATLAALRRVARPVIRAKRAEHQLRLLDRRALDPELERGLMALGLTDRQAEVAFWMLKGKSNSDIATILGIGSQTVRHHSMAIFARLGVNGRLSLQRRVIGAFLDAG